MINQQQKSFLEENLIYLDEDSFEKNSIFKGIRNGLMNVNKDFYYVMDDNFKMLLENIKRDLDFNHINRFTKFIDSSGYEVSISYKEISVVCVGSYDDGQNKLPVGVIMLVGGSIEDVHLKTYTGYAIKLPLDYFHAIKSNLN